MSSGLRYKELQLAQLRSFGRVASAGNFAEAAQNLGLAKATVWQQVRSLERLVGATLVRRRGRAVELTDDGRIFLQMLQPHLTGLDSIVDAFAERQGSMPLRLSVASNPFVLAYHLPQPLVAFHQSYPMVRLGLQVLGSWEETDRAVESGQVDLGVIPHAPDQPWSPNLDYEPLFDMQLSVLTAVRHPLARKKQLTPQDLVDYPLILSPQGAFSRRVFERVLKQHGLMNQARIIMEQSIMDVSRRYVAQGLGIMVVYMSPSVAPSLPELRIRVFDPKLESVSVVLVQRKGPTRPPHVEDFREQVRRYCAQSPAPQR
jgi:DNA-binding transcriptional LysR family regulator